MSPRGPELPHAEVSHRTDSSRQGADFQLQRLFSELSAINVKPSLNDSAHQLLPPLDLAEAAKHPIKHNHATNTIEAGGVTWKQKPDGSWDGGKDLKTGEVRKADSIKITGEGDKAEAIIKQGATTTIQRGDGSKVRETVGHNGSKHDEVYNTKGELTKVVHNGHAFKIENQPDGKRSVHTEDGRLLRTLSIDNKNEIHFRGLPPVNHLSATLKTDGTTVARDEKRHVEATRFGDGSRIDRAINPDHRVGRILNERMSDGQMVPFDNKGKPILKDSTGKLIAPERIEVMDNPPGAMKIKDKDSNRENIYYLNKTFQTQETKDGKTGPTSFTDSDGKTFKFTYDPKDSRDPQNIRSFGPVTVKDGEKVRVPADKPGTIVVTSADGGTASTYDLHARTKTTENGADKTVQHMDKKYEEKFVSGVLQSLKQNDIEWKVKTDPSGKIESLSTDRLELKQSPTRSLALKDGEIVVSDTTSTGRTETRYKPDGSASIKTSDGHSLNMKLDRHGQPTEITDDKGAVYKIEHDEKTKHVSKLTDGDGKPVKINGPDGTPVELDPSKYVIGVSADGKIQVQNKPEDKYFRATVDPLRHSEIVDTDTKAIIKTPSAKVEIEGSKPATLKVTDSKGTSTDVKVPAEIKNLNWSSMHVTDSGKIEIKTKDGTGKITIDPERKSTTLETTKTVGGKEVTTSAVIFDKDGNKKFSADFDDAGKVTSWKLGDGRAIKIPDKSNLEMRDGDLVFKNENMAITYHGDGSRDFVTRAERFTANEDGFRTHQEWRGRDGKTVSTQIEYGAGPPTPDGQKPVKEIKFANGMSVQPSDADPTKKDGPLVLHVPAGIPGMQAGDYPLKNATVDRRGLVHLRAEDGREMILSPYGDQPNRPASFRSDRAAPAPGDIPPPVPGARPKHHDVGINGDLARLPGTRIFNPRHDVTTVIGWNGMQTNYFKGPDGEVNAFSNNLGTWSKVNSNENGDIWRSHTGQLVQANLKLDRNGNLQFNRLLPDGRGGMVYVPMALLPDGRTPQIAAVRPLAPRAAA